MGCLPQLLPGMPPRVAAPPLATGVTGAKAQTQPGEGM